jgi:cytidylate kinase
MSRSVEKVITAEANPEALLYRGNVCISGLTAAGKTTHGHLLAGEFGLTYVSGSQIQLNFMGVSPIQTKDFWITEDAKPLWNKDAFSRIDAELLRIESFSDGCIFDTSTMPWRHRRPALSIWLGSSLESRVLKSIISHRGRSRFELDDYPTLIAEKDASTQQIYKDLYGIRIGEDFSCFDLILDIGSLIKSATLEASLASIKITHDVIRPAVAWYLTGRAEFRLQFEEPVATAVPGLIVHNAVRETLLHSRAQIANSGDF